MKCSFFFSISVVNALAINHNVLMKKARTLENNGFFDEAIESWQELATIKTNLNFVIYAELKLGSTYLKLKQFQKSIDVLKTATKSHPENFDVYFSFDLVSSCRFGSVSVY